MELRESKETQCILAEVRLPSSSSIYKINKLEAGS